MFKRLKKKYAQFRMGLSGEVLRAQPSAQKEAPSKNGDRSSPSSRIAIFGDVHSNIEALDAVLADARSQNVSGFACTGDLVGYGPDPSACLDLIRGLGCPVVKGNHDAYSATDVGLSDFTLNAMNALIWTREHLSPEEREWLNGLPMSADLEGAKIVHSSLVDPAKWHYVMKLEQAEYALRSQAEWAVFFGHTHVPSLFSFNPETEELKMEFPLKEGVHQLSEGWRHLINPGSVGQPRDKDARASYALFDSCAGTVEIRRIEYDFATTQQKIASVGLPLRNAERLERGR